MSFYGSPNLEKYDISDSLNVFTKVISFLIILFMLIVTILNVFKLSFDFHKENKFMKKFFEILFLKFYLTISFLFFQSVINNKNWFESSTYLFLDCLKFFISTFYKSLIKTNLVIEKKPLVIDKLEDLFNPQIETKNLISPAGGGVREAIMMGKTEIYKKLRSVIYRQG